MSAAPDYSTAPCSSCKPVDGLLHAFHCPTHGTWTPLRGFWKTFDRARVARRYEIAGAELLATILPTSPRCPPGAAETSVTPRQPVAKTYAETCEALAQQLLIEVRATVALGPIEALLAAPALIRAVQWAAVLRREPAPSWIAALRIARAPNPVTSSRPT